MLLQLCRRRSPLILLITSTIWCRFWLISIPLLSESNQRKKTTDTCCCDASSLVAYIPSQSGCMHPIPVWLHASICGRLSVRASEVRDQVPDTDIARDYTMKKPWRCLLGAVRRYWRVVAGCFQVVNFAENTSRSAPLSPRASFFSTFSIAFLFICFLALDFVCKTLSHIFLIQHQNLVAFKRRKDIFECFQMPFPLNNSPWNNFPLLALTKKNSLP